MGEGFTFYAIKKIARETAPEGVKTFIDDFFEEKKIFGIDCYVAIDSDHKSPWIDMNDEDYEQGLSSDEKADCGVFTWLKKHPEYVFEYFWS